MGCAPSRVKTVPQSVVRLNFEEIDLIVSDKKVVEQLKSLAPHEYYKDRDFQGISSLCMDETNIPENIKNKDIYWKRPHEYIDNPQLFVDGISRLDIVQGDLGDCWFLCACAAITLKQEIWTRIIPSDNKIFNSKGLYHFRFWRFGDWVDVYIDDLLPMSDGELIYAQAATPSEIWPSLIEKAYAKVNGCYEALQSGKASEGLLDLTGGLTEVYYPPQMKGPELFNVIKQALRNGAFVACNTDNEHDGSRGLITGHAYSVTMANKIPTIEGPKDLLRIFNPWGATEWTGDWSDASDKWHLVPPEVRKTLGLKQELDGEFWMNFNDFCQFFSRVYICTLGPDFDRDGIVDNSKMYSFHGSWIPGHNAGGCSDDVRRYSTNPQYRFTVDSDTKASPTENAPDLVNPLEVDRCFIIVSLMQKFQRSLKKRDLRKSEEYINFRLYKVNESESGKCNEEFFTNVIPIEPVLGEMDYTNTREVTSRFLLQPGEYLLVPSTFDHDVPASFLLRLYAWTSQFKCWETHDR